MDYDGMQIEILELFVEAKYRALPRRVRSVVNLRERVRFATITRAVRRSLDDRRNRRDRAPAQASTEAQAAVSEALFRAAYASTFTAAQARLRGPRPAESV